MDDRATALTRDASRTPLGLYLHIPWCPTRCVYCDFNTYVGGEGALRARYAAALGREIGGAGTALGRPELATIFFGGGTPTTLPAAVLGGLVERVRAAFRLRPGAEISCEANPGTLSTDYLRALRAGGINRLSMGVQSFDDGELRLLGRLHDGERARAAVGMARAAGFDNLNLDLIYNLPYQRLEGWARTLDVAIGLAPDHLSLYSLMIKPGTPLQREIARGTLPEPDEARSVEMLALAAERLVAAGYVQYEISNWARDQGEPAHESPALASAHNLIYWRHQPYLGLGAGAHSAHGDARWANVRHPERYIERIEAGSGLAPARDERTVEPVTGRDALDAHLMLGLRLTREGIGSADFERRFGVALAARFPTAIADGVARGWLEWVVGPSERRLRLTEAGARVADRVAVGFLAEG